MSPSVEFLVGEVWVSAGGAHFFIWSTMKSVDTCDNNSVNLLHDVTVTICCVNELESTRSDMTGSVVRKLWYDNDMY